MMRRRSSISLRLVLAMALLLSAMAAAAAQDLEQSRKRRAALERDIAILRSQLTATVNKSEEALSTISMIRAQEASRRKLIEESDRSIASYSSQIACVQDDIARQQAVLDTLQAHYSRLVLGAYKNRDVRLWYMYILSSDNVSQAFRRFGYFKSLSSQIQTQARQVEKLQLDLNARKAELLNLKAAAQSVKNIRQKELNSLKEDESRQKTLVASLKKNQKEYKASLLAKQKEKSALDKKIAQMIAAAASSKKGSGKDKKVDYTLSQSFESNKGKLPWPVEGPVTEHYGPYQNKELRLSLFNNGINVACESGAAVKAVFDGVVSNIMLAPGYGQCILVQHGSYYTSYCKIKTAFVHQGDKVSTGQVIGEVATIMGKTQLYFLVWKKQYLDPELWLRPR